MPKIKEPISTLSPIKGRPMLNWLGKRPLEQVKGYPAQLQELYGTTQENVQPFYDEKDWQNLLLHGDNLEVLGTLLLNGYRGKVDLIYIDPPFDSKANYTRSVALRGESKKLNAEGYNAIEQLQYSDMWQADAYLQFMYERLILLKELLSEQGSIYLHCDHHKNHHLRLIMDEIFGEDNFVNEISWYYPNKFKFDFSKHFGTDTESLFIYAKSTKNHILNHIKVPVKNKRKQNKVTWDAEAKKMVTVKDEEGNVVYYDSDEKIVGTMWEIPRINSMANEVSGYPTQKPEALLERIIKASSNPNSLVLDCFAGSGTTPAVAQKLGRRWIACDINKGAIQTTAKRLSGIMQTQAQQLNVGETQPTLNYAYYRVNNYDLQEQHNEFKGYVLSHYGVEPDKKQAFFDGVRGDRLVKVVPFTQPATIEDLQLIQAELKLNPNESRPIDLFCLGAELRLQEAIKQHNRLNPINKITVIDIRLEDGIIQHQPAELSITTRIEGSELFVELVNYISPTITKRLCNENENLLEPLDDFKRQLEWVCIDADYNGSVFKPTVQEAPLKKKDIVQGVYRLLLSTVGERIAVKTIDILGEEVLVVVGDVKSSVS